MATAQREGGFYYTDRGIAVDAEGKHIAGAPKPSPDTDPSKQPGAQGAVAADPMARLADLLAGKVPATKGASKAAEPEEEVEPPTLAELPDHLAGLKTVADVKALQKGDKRVGAQKLYEARLAELSGDGEE